MVAEISVDFDDNPQGIYYAGQYMYGTINIKCDKPKEVREVHFKIKGFCHVHWTEQHSRTVNGKRETYTKSYDGHEDYLKVKTVLLAPEGSESTLKIEPGTYTFKFNTQIPPNAPSSFEGEHGHVRYSIKVVLVRPWKFDESHTRPFNVLQPMDLNMNSSSRSPMEITSKKTFCCFPCGSKPLRMHAAIPQMGYVPGQSIPITIDVENYSHVPIHSSSASLIMTSTFYSTAPNGKRETTSTIATIEGKGVEKNSNDVLNLVLPVPVTPPTFTDHGYLIHVTYELEISLEPNGFHFSLSKKIPCILIGNIPLNMNAMINTQQQYQQQYQQAYQPALQQPYQPLMQPKFEPARPIGFHMNAVTHAPYPADGKGGPMAPCLPPPLPYSAALAPMPGTSQYPPANPAMQPIAGPSVPSMEATDGLPLQQRAEIPPPSYEEAVHLPTGKQEVKSGTQDYGNNVFRPCYPRFDIPSPTAPALDDVNETYTPAKPNNPNNQN